MRALRPTLAKAAPDAAERVADGAHMDQLARFKVVAGYRPIQDEIDPGPLMQRLAAGGATLALPVTPPKGSNAPLGYHRWSNGEALHLSAFKVQEPDASAPRVVPDLVITPLVAFDRAGARLGYGQGHFDRTLQALRRDHAVFVLGLAYAGQEVPRLPVEPHDERFDAVLTERGWIEIAP
jgi:5-formyltetrahydrofolate cyclo-ligase